MVGSRFLMGAVCGALLLSLPVTAQPSQSIYNIEFPPPEFDGAPPLAPVVVVYNSLFETDRICRAIGLREAERRIWGCAFRLSTFFCLVFIPNQVPTSLTNEMYRHEYGHCAGWVHE